MKRTITTLAIAFTSILAIAQDQFKGQYFCKDLAATLTINLSEKNISLKDLDFDETYGYLKGNFNGTWVILKVKKADDSKALVRMVSDMGNDAQDVEFTINKEGNLEMRLVGEQNIKAVDERKYVKFPKVAVFTR